MKFPTRQYVSCVRRVIGSISLGFLLLLSQLVYGQENHTLDSLLTVFQSGNYPKESQLILINKIAEAYTDPEKILQYGKLLRDEANQQGATSYTYLGVMKMGYAYQLKSDYEKALGSYFEAAKHVRPGIQTGALYNNIADVYSLMRNHRSAVQYYQNAIRILTSENDSNRVAATLYNLGDEYLKNQDFDSALKQTKASQSMYHQIKDPLGEAYCLGNLGVIYLKKGFTHEAEMYLNRSIILLNELNEYSPICEFLLSISDIHKQRKNLSRALQYAKQSLELGNTYHLKKEISEANLALSKLYELMGNLEQSLLHFKSYITYRDSVNNIEGVQRVADMRTDFEVSRKQKEVDLLATKNKLRIAERNGLLFASLLLTLVLVISIYYYTHRVKRNKMMADQKMKEAEINHQKNLMQSVITSQEDERKRIGMDLHDEVGAALSTLRLKMDQQTDDVSYPQLPAKKYKEDIDKIIKNMRNISHALSPRLAGTYGFYDAIHELADGVNQSEKIQMSIHFDENNLPVFKEDQIPMALYRVIAELINNTLKHAQAKHIQLDVDVKEDEMRIHYADDGKGISQSFQEHVNGIGMHNMESRLGVIGATWKIQTSSGNGYHMYIQIPIK